MKVKDLGSAYNVSVSEEEIKEFNRRWPVSELRGLRGVTFQFDKRNGDLIDIWYKNGSSDRWDGSAGVALSFSKTSGFTSLQGHTTAEKASCSELVRYTLTIPKSLILNGGHLQHPVL